jgi:hypothetical protein
MKKILATILALVLALGLTATVWAADVSGSTSTKAAKIGDTEYDTLQAAIYAASDGENTVVVLLNDLTESITVAKEKSITLDLSGYTLTNEAGKHTITNYGDLTITSTGVVDNVSHACAALVNKEDATAELNGGSFTRSQENGQSKEDSGGNSYYNIQNFGMMTINDGVLVKQDGGFSSMVANGYYYGTDKTNTPTLIINGGKFIGGLNTIKNDDCGKLTINNGVFENVEQHAVFNVNEAEIKGGTYAMDGNDSVLYNRKYNDTNDKGLLTVKGGTFTAKDGVPAIKVYDANSNPTVTGGAFSSDVSAYAGNNAVASLKNVYYVGTDSIEAAVNSMSGGDTLTVIKGSVKVGNTEYGANQTYTKPTSYYYYSPSTTTPDTTKGSPKTFDAGVGIYAVTAVLSVTGMAWTAKKRH